MLRVGKDFIMRLGVYISALEHCRKFERIYNSNPTAVNELQSVEMMMEKRIAHCSQDKGSVVSVEMVKGAVQSLSK